ncbi:MAG TPA: serine/threonine-protein kinase [Kofleriaceae bacterium]|nr:serine/threonine-protein kinase [Kofleriaceae bacterium]
MAVSGDDATVPSPTETPAGDDATAVEHAGGSGDDAMVLAPGGTIGRYRILDVVGAGGAGVVLSAHDTELGRRVAIKVLLRDYAEARVRLVREAQAMAKLSHRNVVTVHEIIRAGSGTGIVMELVDGVNLATWRRAAARAWREVVDVYIQAGRGLAAAHRMGLVHRDFKPGNALIDGDGVVRVTDFGLVRATGDATDVTRSDGVESKDLALTRSGALLGTPAYMAPEQHAGEPTDARTDQWALACSLYGALYEQRPFAGDTIPEIAEAVLAGTIRIEPRDTAVPRHIRTAIRRALARKPGDRFASVDEFVSTITPRSRRAWVLAGVGAVAVAGTATAIVLATRAPAAEGPSCDGLGAAFEPTWNPERAAALTQRGVAARVVTALDRYRDDWTAARTRACAETRRGASSPDLLDRRNRCLEQRRLEIDTIVAAWLEADRKTLDDAVAVVGSLRPIAECDDPRETMPLPAEPALRAEVQRGEDLLTRASALGEVGLFDRGMPLSTEAVSIAEKTGYTPLLARALAEYGRALSHANDGPGALAAFDRAATAAALAHDDHGVADALVSRAWTLASDLGKPADALAGTSYVELALQRAGNPPRLRGNWLHHVAVAHYWLRQYDEAVAAENESLAILRKVLAADNVAIMDGIANLSVFETARNNLDEAAALLQQRLDYDIAQRGPDHPEVGSDYLNLGNIAQRRGDMVAAEASYSRAFEILRAAGDDAWVAPAALCSARYQLGRWSSMLDACETALAWAEKTAPGDSIPVMVTARKLAVALTKRDPARASVLADRSVAAARATKGRDIADAIGSAALIALARGDKAVARRHLADASSLDYPDTDELPLAQGELARVDRDCATARAAYQRAIVRAQRLANEMTITRAAIGIAECQIAAGQAADALAALDARVKRMEEVGAEPAAVAALGAVRARALAAR